MTTTAPGPGTSTGAPTPPAEEGPVRRVGLPLAARRLAVRDVVDLSRSLRRVSLAGADLAGFAAHGPADHAKVFFPAEPGEPVAGPLVVDGRWLDRDAPHVVRDYTVRTFRPGDDALVVDLVPHPHGPAGRWAAQAAPGQELVVLGPRGSAIPPLERAEYLLAADETGLPALLNWLDRLPASARVRAFVEVDGPEDELLLPLPQSASVTWLHRHGAPAGTTTLLVDAVADALAERDPFAAGPTGAWAWAAAEASQVRAIRALLTARGLDRGSFAMTGYWRVGVANFDHHSPDA